MAESDSWMSHPYAADGKVGPTPRNVSALLRIVLNNRTYLAISILELDSRQNFLVEIAGGIEDESKGSHIYLTPRIIRKKRSILFG